MNSPLDFDNSALGNPSANKKDSKGKKGKLKGTSPFKNPIIKEIMPLGVYSVLTVIAIGGSLFYTNSVNSDYALSNYGDMKNIESLSGQLENQITQRGAMKAELESTQNQLSSLSLSMEEQNMMKTPLTQGYYFISYLTYLSEKYGVHLDELKVLANDGSSEIDLTTITNATGSYDLLPIEVNMIATTEQLQSLMNEMYTKRIIQVKNLNIANNLDTTVRAKFQVYFTDTESIMQQQQQVDQAITDAGFQGGQTDPSLPEGELLFPEGNGAPQQEEGLLLDGSQDGLNTGGNNTEVNNNANLTEEQIQQHYDETGEIIDPISGEVIN